jgi:hypothetical protein
VGLESKQEDWRDNYFTAILANIREEAPITLVFAAATPKKPTNQEMMVDPAPKPKEGDSIQCGMSALSAWGSRVRARSEKLAANAATNASAMAIAAKELWARQLQQQQQQEQQASVPPPKPCNVFLQTSVGAFISAALAQKVTTSSLLLVRKSATESCPPADFPINGIDRLQIMGMPLQWRVIQKTSNGSLWREPRMPPFNLMRPWWDDNCAVLSRFCHPTMNLTMAVRTWMMST